MTHTMRLKRSFLSALNNSTCPAVNTPGRDGTSFYDHEGWHFDAHRVGWIVAGCFSLFTFMIAAYNIRRHCRNYRRPLPQRQVVRILMMPVVFAVMSFIGYRFYRQWVYFALIRDCYEAFCMAAFLSLILYYLSDYHSEQLQVIGEKRKQAMVFPLCCWRYRPSKPYFIWAVKWSVLQFVVVKPACAIAGTICETYDVLCVGSVSFKFASIYLMLVDLVAVSLSLYGLILLYALVHSELKGKRPFSKFMTIKVIVALVFYQGFCISILEGFHLIQGTEYWTERNIADGLNALATTIEMALIALWQLYAFPVSEFKPELKDDREHTSGWRSFLHSQNYSDFLLDMWRGLVFLVHRIRGESYTKTGTSFVAPTDSFQQQGNSYDLEGAFDFGAESFIPDDDADADSLKPIDPQRPYIVPASWDTRNSQKYPPSRASSSRTAISTDTTVWEKEGAMHSAGTGGKEGYKKLAGEDDDLDERLVTP